MVRAANPRLSMIHGRGLDSGGCHGHETNLGHVSRVLGSDLVTAGE